MKTTKIGIIKEGKQPPDQRVAFLPFQINALTSQYPSFKFIVQSSNVRCVKDQEYMDAGIPVKEDISDCDILFGIKEVPIDQLIPNKTYFFFSHTIKKQAYNRKLLQAILEKNITLIDYECLTDNLGNRLVAFGKYAGLVGAYNALWVWGMRTKEFELKRGFTCKNLQEMFDQLKHMPLSSIKIALTGGGRVAQGAIEMIEAAGVKRVSVNEFLNENFQFPVYAQLRSKDYYQHKRGSWDSNEFYHDPSNYDSIFSKFISVTDILIHSAFWDQRAAPLFSSAQMREPAFNIKVIADITCDIKGSIPSTIKASTINDPVYDYDPESEEERPPFSNKKHINVMAIDNLPTEVPLDASKEFGDMLSKHVIPNLSQIYTSEILQRAIITNNGSLTTRYDYLEDFVSSKV